MDQLVAELAKAKGVNLIKPEFYSGFILSNSNNLSCRILRDVDKSRQPEKIAGYSKKNSG